MEGLEHKPRKAKSMNFSISLTGTNPFGRMDSSPKQGMRGRMALYPRARLRLIDPPASDPRIRPRTGILHVDAGNAYDLYDYFKNLSGGIESHFHIPKAEVKGVKLFQYRNTEFQADANYYANEFAISVETQGYGIGEWTEHQLTEIKHLMLWCQEAHSIPLRVMSTWNDLRGGWGFHTLFGAPSKWTPVSKSCPGEQRKDQFFDVLVPWMKKVSEDDMFEVEDRELLEHVSEQVTALNAKLNRINKRETERDQRLKKLIKQQFKATDQQLEDIFDAVND
jgi:hypothetical protein